MEDIRVHIGILGHLLNFTPGYRQAGVSRYVEHLVRALPDVVPGDALTVYAGRRTVPRDVAQSLAPAATWKLSALPTDRPLVRILWEQLATPFIIRGAGLDLIHAPVNVAPFFSSRPTVVTVHDLAFLIYPEQYPGAKQRYLNALTRLSVKRAARVIAVSENTRQDVIRFYGVPPERVVTVPNGLDPSFHDQIEPERLERFRRERSLPEQFILFLGTVQPRKNLVGLLRSWARLPASSRLPLVVVGATGWLYEPVFAEARSLGVADEVHFAGYADASSLPLWYSAATVFVYPSLYEGFGLQILEAMACGTPVITSSRSSLPEVAGDAACLVDPDDIDALTAALARLIDDAEMRADMRRRGRVRAREYSWERTARETSAVYHLAAARPD